VRLLFDSTIRLRANPRWELVLRDELDGPLRQAIGDDLPDDAYGVLRSTAGSSRIKVVGPDTALLFLTLQAPRPLPRYIRGSFGEEAAAAVGELIADEVLEAEIDGAWRSGAAAFRRSSSGAARTDSVCATRARSIRALQAALGLPEASEAEIASFLYRYGTVPITTERARRWADASRIWNDLGLDRFRRSPSLSTERTWWIFPGPAADGPQPKLYVGVALSALPEALAALATLWNEAGESAPSFKVGANVPALHRPDRVVVYPVNEDSADDWAERMAAVLRDFPAEPVPFTHGEVPGGQLSRGRDPAPPVERDWDEEGSWRSVLSRRLARDLTAAQRAGDPEPWSFALARGELAAGDANR
jgi:hypothetical protein